MSHVQCAMDDGGQRLLDVIEDTHVLETFLRENFSNSGLEDSPRYDNVSSSTDSGLISSGGLDSLVFDGQMVDPLRGAPSHPGHHSHQVSPHVLQQVLHPPSGSTLPNGPSSHQLHTHHQIQPHQHHNLHTSALLHQSLQSSLGANLDADCLTTRNRDNSCSRHDADNTLQQLLAAGSVPPLCPSQQILQLQQHQQVHYSQPHQNHPPTSPLLSSQSLTSPNQNSIPHNQFSRPQHRNAPQKIAQQQQQQHLPHLNHHVSDMPGSLLHLGLPTTMDNNAGNRITTLQPSVLSQPIIPSNDTLKSVALNMDITANLQSIQSNSSSNKVQIISPSHGQIITPGSQILASTTPSQLLSSSTQITQSPASQLLAGNQVLSNINLISGSLSGMHNNQLPSGITQVLANSSTGLAVSASPAAPLYVTPSGTQLIPNSTPSASITTTTATVTTCSFVIPSKSPISAMPRASSVSSSFSSSVSPVSSYAKSPSPIAVRAAPISCASVQQTTSAAPILQGLVSHLPITQLAPQNSVVFTQGNAPIKQIMQGGQLIQLVSSTPVTQTIKHSVALPKPIQPKQPQLLPKPSPQGIGLVRQPTPPPPSTKTILGTRSVPPTQQPIMIGTSAGTPQTVIAGQQNLGSIVINSSLLQAQPFLIPQPNGMQLLVRPAGTTATGQTILLPMQSQSSINKVPQTFMIPVSGQAGPLVIQQGLTSTMGGASMITSGGRAPQPLIGLLAPQAAPLQLQQINTPTGPMLVALPQQSINLPGMFASNAVRTLAPQVATNTLQLAAQAIAPASGVNLNHIQISGNTLQPIASGQSTHISIPSVTPIIKCEENIVSRSNLSSPRLVNCTTTVENFKTTQKKKSKKKKRESKDGKEVSINLNELLKETGIVSEMMFDENDFANLDIEQPSQNCPQTTSQSLPIVNTISPVKIPFSNNQLIPLPTPPIKYTVSSNQIPASNQLSLVTPTAAVSSSMCFTFDPSGKLVLGTMDATKSQITVAGGLPTQVTQSSMQVLPSTALNLSRANIVIGNNDVGQNIMTIPNESPTLIKLDQLGSKTVPFKNEIIRVVQNTQLLDGTGVTTANSPIITSLLSNGPIVSCDARNNSKLVNTPSQTPVIVSLNNAVTTGSILNGKLLSTPETISALTPRIDNKLNITYSNDQVPHIHKNSFITESKPKKSKKKNKEKEVPVYFQPSNDKISENESPVNGCIKNDCPDMVNLSQSKKASISSNACSMPTIISSPLSSPSSATKPTVASNSSTAPVIVTGPQMVLQPGQQVKQLFISPQNQEALKKVHSQIQELQSRKIICDSDKVLYQKLITDYKKIMATGTPISVNPEQTVQHVNQQNKIKYSHAVGHKKILFTPNQKKNQNKKAEPTKCAASKPKEDTFTAIGTSVNASQGIDVTANIQINLPLNNVTTPNSYNKTAPTSPFIRLSPGNSNVINTMNNLRPATATIMKVSPGGIMPSTSVMKLSPVISPTSSLMKVTPGAIPPPTVLMKVSPGTMPPSATLTKISPGSNSSTATLMKTSPRILTHPSNSPHTSLVNSSEKTNQRVSEKNIMAISSLTHDAKHDSMIPSSMPMLSQKMSPSLVVSAAKSEAQSGSSQSVTCNNRIPSPIRSPFNIPLTRDQLFEHQLRTDQNGAFSPDYKTPFKSKTDACKRLIRYHVYSDRGQSPQDLLESDHQYESTAETLLKKFSSMKYKYQSLLLKDSMRRHPSSETAMLYRLFIQEEKHNLEKERQDVMNGKNLQLPSVPPHWVTGDEPPPYPFMPWEDSWPNEKAYTLSYKDDEEEHQPSPPPAPDEEEEPRLQIHEEEEEEEQEEVESDYARRSPITESRLQSSGESEYCDFYPEGASSSSPYSVWEKRWRSDSETRFYPPDDRTSRSTTKVISTKENEIRLKKSKKRDKVPPIKIRSKEEHLRPNGGVAKLKLTLKKQQGSGDYYRVDKNKCGDYYRVDEKKRTVDRDYYRADDRKRSGEYYDKNSPADFYRVDDDENPSELSNLSSERDPRRMRNLSVVLEDCKKKQRLKEAADWSPHVKEDWGAPPPASYVDRWVRSGGPGYLGPNYCHPSTPEVVNHRFSSS